MKNKPEVISAEAADALAEPYRSSLRVMGFEPVGEPFPQRFFLPNTPVVATVDITETPVITYDWLS